MAKIYILNKQANKYSVNSFIYYKGDKHIIIKIHYYEFRKNRTHTKFITKKVK